MIFLLSRPAEIELVLQGSRTLLSSAFFCVWALSILVVPTSGLSCSEEPDASEGEGFKEGQMRRFPQNLADPTARFQLMQRRHLLPGVCLSGWPCKSYGFFLRENATRSISVLAT